MSRVKYLIKVDIHEVMNVLYRDVSKESNDIPNLFITVKVGSKQQSTSTKENASNAIFNTSFNFTVDLTPGEFQRTRILVTLHRQFLIQSAEIGHHASWARVICPYCPSHNAGMILASVGVFGPGDHIPVFRDSDAAGDVVGVGPSLAGGIGDEISAQTRLTRAPELQVKYYVLNFDIVCGRDFVPTSGLLGNVLEPYVKVYHGGIDVCTAVIKNNPNPEWQATLYIPCITPSFDELVTVEVWNGEGNGELLHYESIDLRFLFSNGFPARWINIYCKPPPDESLTDYGGRILMSASAVQVQSPPVKGIRPCKSGITPPSRLKVLWADIYEIVPLEDYAPATIELIVSMGPYSNKTGNLRVKKNGTYQVSATSGRLPSLEFLVSTASDDDLWDVFLYINETSPGGDAEPVRYAWKRIPFSQIQRQESKPMWCILSSCSNFVTDAFHVLATFQMAADDDSVPRKDRIEYTLKEYLFRAMIYEALHLPCLDFSNFPNSSVEIELAGTFIKSATAQSCLHPLFYESHEIEVRLPSNLLLAPDVSIAIYSEPVSYFSGRELLCSGQYSLSKVPKEWTRAPTWVALKSQKNPLHRPCILVSFELVPLDEHRMDPERFPFFDDIRPSTIASLVSLLVIGIRMFKPLSDPRLVIQVGTEANGRQRVKIDKVVSGCEGNWNFLSTHTLSVALPKRMQHHSFLEFIIYDGQQCVGITYLTLNPLLPWLTIDERSASRELFKMQLLEDFLATGESGESKADKKKCDAPKDVANAQKSQDDVDAMNVKAYETFDYVELTKPTNPCPNVASRIVSSGEIQPRGEGEDGAALDEAEERDFSITLYDEDEYENPQVEMEDVPYEMECDYSPEELPYMRAPIVQCTSAGVPETVGMLKFVCTVQEAGGGSDGDNLRKREALKMRQRRDKFLDLYAKARDLVVRVYALEAKGLCTSNDDVNPTTYLWVRNTLKEGTHISSYQQNITETRRTTQGLKPIFNCCFNVGCALPENAILAISVKRANALVDEVIGTTYIDCEDRFLNSKIQSLASMGAMPAELRTLKSEASTVSHGTLRCKVQVMDVATAKTTPQEGFSLLESCDYELRVVIWRVKGIATDGGTVSFYVRGTFQVDEAEQLDLDTDTHRHSRDGTGIFNWRFKFPIHVPSEYTQLKLQVYTLGLIGTSEMLGETNIDLRADLARLRRTKVHKIGKCWYDVMHAAHANQTKASIQVEMSLVSQTEAQASPVGLGRDAPNRDPFLPQVLENRDLLDWDQLKNTIDSAGGAILSGLKWTGMFIACAACFALLLLVIVLIR